MLSFQEISGEDDLDIRCQPWHWQSDRSESSPRWSEHCYRSKNSPASPQAARNYIHCGKRRLAEIYIITSETMSLHQLIVSQDSSHFHWKCSIQSMFVCTPWDCGLSWFYAAESHPAYYTAEILKKWKPQGWCWKFDSCHRYCSLKDLVFTSHEGYACKLGSNVHHHTLALVVFFQLRRPEDSVFHVW